MTDLSRRAAVHVDARWLIDMLELPADVEVVAVDAQNDPVGIRVIVTKPDLPVVDSGLMAPMVHRYITVSDSGRTVTWMWPDG
jgi:hypothetical protein